MVHFRTANHKLPIELGRWNNIEYDERKCDLCDQRSIGDEFHYLLECDKDNCLSPIHTVEDLLF